jgi:hypothetical protein
MTFTERQLSPDGAIEFVIGRDERGFWTARDVDGREGGLFISRDEAVKFAETTRRRGHGVVKSADAPVRLWK